MIRPPAEARIPVMPVTIGGTRSALRGGQWFPRRSQISIRIGAPLAPIRTGFEAALRLRDAAHAKILAQCGEPDLSHERPI